MKNKLNSAILPLAALLTALSGSAWAISAAPLIKEQPHAIYHVVKNKTLLAVTSQLSNRSGITFKLNAAVEHDVISQKLAAENWKDALTQLLDGYNYTIETDHGRIKTVLITGRHGSGQGAAAIPTTSADFVIVAPDVSKKLPDKYKNFNPGSVMTVNLPLQELAEVPVGTDLTLDLPIGQYRVKHDNLFDHGDGTSTWIGYLDQEGKGYRVYLSQGETGVMGNIYTPDGNYAVETVDGQTVIVDLEKSGLQTAGFENDDAEPTAAALMEAGAQTADDAITDLKTAAEIARAKANALAKEAKSLYFKYLKAIATAKTTQNQLTAAKAAVVKAEAYLSGIQATLAKNQHNGSLKVYLKMAASSLNNANNRLAKAISANDAAQNNLPAFYADFTKKLDEARAAEANAKTAEAAYAAELAKINPVPSASASVSTGPVVDLMVLYTTSKQTAAYAKQRINYLVDVSNQAYQDSGIAMRLRLVHTRSTSYVETNANSQALSDLAGDRGAFAGTAALRNQYGADLVMLFRPLYAKTAGSCGTAYVGFANGGSGNASFGYGTIGDGYSKDALSNYYCGLNTFTHEIGHSLGNVHDREYSSFTGKFSYSYAWGIDGKFGTIMSYYDPSIMLFSTPKLASQCAGTPCGFPEGSAKSSDQARTINYTAPFVSSYKPTTVSVPVIQ